MKDSNIKITLKLPGNGNASLKYFKALDLMNCALLDMINKKNVAISEEELQGQSTKFLEHVCQTLNINYRQVNANYSYITGTINVDESKVEERKKYLIDCITKKQNSSNNNNNTEEEKEEIEIEIEEEEERREHQGIFLLINLFLLLIYSYI